MAPECPIAGDYRVNPAGSRLAYEAFWNTGSANFWGASNHIELFMERLRVRAPAVNLSHPILIDAGAAPYNTIGGDISHVLAYLRLWGCGGAGAPAKEALTMHRPIHQTPPDSAALIMAFEPMKAPFDRLLEYVQKAMPSDLSLKQLPNGAAVLDSGAP